jgi:hypothetical protein
VPAGKVSFSNRKILRESEASCSSQLLSNQDQVGFHSLNPKNPNPGEFSKHERIIELKSDSSQNSIQFLSTPQLGSNFNRADISETQPLNYDKALNSSVNMNAVNCLQSDKEIIVDQKNFTNKKTLTIISPNNAIIIQHITIQIYPEEEKIPLQQEGHQTTRSKLSFDNHSNHEIIETNPQGIFQNLIAEITKDFEVDSKCNSLKNKEILADNNNHYAAKSQLVYPEVIIPKTKPVKIQQANKRKTFTDVEEQELRDILKYTGYSKAEIQEKIERKRIKYGRAK